MSVVRLRKNQRILHLLLLALGGASGVFAACTDEEKSPVADTPDAQADTYVPRVDTGVPVFDAGTDANVDDLPQFLQETGLYSDIMTKTLAAGVKPYKLAVGFWSDGAEKNRYVYLPPGEKIDTSNMDEWVFPVGTKLWKEFHVEGKLLETRIFWKTAADHWLFSTYLWSSDETSAKRHDDGVLPSTDGGYEVPLVSDCRYCHKGRRDMLLGFEARALGHPGSTGVNLATLVADGRLTVNPPSTTITPPNEGDAGAGPALDWLHINCGVACHNRNPEAAANFTGLYLRLNQKGPDGGVPQVTSTDSYTTTVNQALTSYAADPKYTAFKRIIPRDVAHSLVPTLAGSRVRGQQMPPIISHQVDEAGVDTVNYWINHM